MLKGKHIVLGITGSIAAYKACLIIRGLIKRGAEVQVVITPSGKEFITPITLSALTHKPVVSEFFSQRDGTWNSHVDLGLWADAMLIAPCTASTMGKMAHGIADNMLITTYLSMKAPVFIAPAMDLDMYKHPSTQQNMETLKSYGNTIIEPASGFLASGLEGKGRMEEPEVIVDFIDHSISNEKEEGLISNEELGISNYDMSSAAHAADESNHNYSSISNEEVEISNYDMSSAAHAADESNHNYSSISNEEVGISNYDMSSAAHAADESNHNYSLLNTNYSLKNYSLLNTNYSLKNRKILITAGPTYEKIDPVRFIGNYSSGKMGFAIAEECYRRGADVTLIAGPVNRKCSEGIHRIDVESCEEMYQASISAFKEADAAILSAAVADFRPEEVADKKIKREKDDLVLRLQPTHDIAAALGKMKSNKQKLICFALETNDEQANAEKKLKKKNADFIVLNSTRIPGTTFGTDENQITIISKEGKKDYEKKPKTEVARDIVDELERRL